MERRDIETWLAHHPGSIHSDQGILLDRCETETKNYARRDAWMHAMQIAQKKLRTFEHSFGLPAGDTFVTREVCHEIARELKHHEPHLDDHDAHEWLSRSLFDAFEPEAQLMLHDWLKELADREEHSTWREIVRLTDHMARTLIEKGRMTDQCEWDLDHTYPRVAARVIRMLITEFEAYAAAGLEGSTTTMRRH